ncbi:LysR family transcriptional regulator [Micromonospora sp. NBC_00898]|uniref:LysR family transcriptional regulator n=1 Tax=Micromonospora sp. NBC_00898 TaxID=2975981 RepID=UPI0038666D40|nr:LysR family transcriptional regulator [Micromonospora sp. NBC_00898]WSX82269.1 LysR family transcriptional regulator [Micromonospora sp. NBC_00898]
MLFRQLEYFVALAREQHFARAAAACYVSQPALSEAIRKLERELDVPLVRRGRAFQGLTPEGERLVLWARRILADHDALKQEVTALKSGLAGQLRLGLIPAATTTVALLVEPFCATHPLARVRLDGGLPTAEIVERLRRFELDAGVVYLSELDTTELTVLPLYRERMVLVASDDLLPPNTEKLSWQEVTLLPLCLLKPRIRGRQAVDDALAAEGLSVAPQIETDSVDALYAHVGTDRWASLVPQPWNYIFRLPAGLRVISVTGAPASSDVGLVTAAAEPGSVLGRAFAAVAATLRLDVLFNPEVDAGHGKPVR